MLTSVSPAGGYSTRWTQWTRPGITMYIYNNYPDTYWIVVQDESLPVVMSELNFVTMQGFMQASFNQKTHSFSPSKCLLFLSLLSPPKDNVSPTIVGSQPEIYHLVKFDCSTDMLYNAPPHIQWNTGECICIMITLTRCCSMGSLPPLGVHQPCAGKGQQDTRFCAIHTEIYTRLSFFF